MVRIFLSFCQKDNINLPQPDDKQILLTLRHLQHTQLKHAKSSHKTQTALGFWKDVGQLKNGNGWQFVGDGGSSQFIITSCCNVPLCVAELVYWLLYRLRLELYVDITYVSGEWTNPATHSGTLQQLVMMNCDELSSPTNCHPFLFFSCPTSFQKPSAVCVLWLICACFSWVCWRCLRVRRICLSSGWGRLMLSFWQNDKWFLPTLNVN